VLHGDEPALGQVERHAALGEFDGYELHPTAFIAESAHVVADTLRVGRYSLITACCVVRGQVEAGDHTSLNAGAVTIGRVTIGSQVPIASYAVPARLIRNRRS